MKILGIETSCDETAAAVVEDGQKVLSNVIASQVKLHAQTGGVVPEVAAREHVIKILPVIEAALRKNTIDAIAVTQGPGLISSLLVGTNTATVLTRVLNKPLIPVNHIEGHIYANWLERDDIQFPIMVLTVSGGHNELILMREHGIFEEVGTTLDDAAGEAFDKVARLLGLGYPGGPAISKIAEKGDPTRFKLPRAWLKPSFDFSFSGLKTAVIRELEKVRGKITDQFRWDLAASFQEAVTEVLAEKLVVAATATTNEIPHAHTRGGKDWVSWAPIPLSGGDASLQNRNAAAGRLVREMHLAGGVSANNALREKTKEKLIERKLSISFRYPKKMEFCTDNAAMIAAAAYFKYQKAPGKYKRWRNAVAESGLKF